MSARTVRWLRRRPYDILLVLLVTIIFGDGLLPDSRVAELVLAIIGAVLPLAAIVALLEDRIAMQIGIWVGVPATAAMLQAALGMRLVPDWVVLTCPLGICILASYVIVRHVVSTPHVDRNAIRGGICGYLMLGYTWAIAYVVGSYLQPGAFLVHGVPLQETLDGDTAIYLSFMTLTTLGYGDIVAARPLVRSIAISEAIAGVMYLAIIVSSLVSARQNRSWQGHPE